MLNMLSLHAARLAVHFDVIYSLRAVRPCPFACLCVSNTYYLWLVCMAFGWIVPCASWQASTILLLLLWHAL